MTEERFGAGERRLVITHLEKTLGVNLARIGRFQKYLLDGNNHRYVVLGGYGDWHGIDQRFVVHEERHPGSTTLVIVKCLKHHFDMFACPFVLLVEHKDRLTFTQDGYYEFNIESYATHLRVREIPRVRIDKFTEMPVHL